MGHYQITWNGKKYRLDALPEIECQRRHAGRTKFLKFSKAIAPFLRKGEHCVLFN